MAPSILAELLGRWCSSSVTLLLSLKRIGLDPGILGQKRASAKKLFSSQGYKLLLEAYQRSPDTSYVAQTEDMPRIILSPRFLPELDMLPETTLSHRESINLRHLGSFTGMGIVLQSHLHSDICRVQLRRALPQLMPHMALKVDEALTELLLNANTETFLPVPAMRYSFFSIARIFSYVFVGEPLCQNEDWIQAIAEYPKVMVAVSGALRPWNPYLRPLVAPFIRPMKDLRAYQDKLHRLFDPVLDSRRKTHTHNDPLQWLIDLAAPHEADNHSILLKLMFLTLAAIHTSAMALDHMILDLCSKPECIESLRHEIKEAVAATDGSWTFDTLSKLPKLDSFMQESRRFNHPAAPFHRLALKDVKLSNGFTIPKGWMISMPAEAMSQDSNIFANPTEFDENRFLPREKKGTGNQFSSILPGNLSWGHGRFTCPGRWYADAQIKLVLGKTIETCNFRFPGGSTSRPANFHVDERISTDPQAMIEIQKISK